jgi:hypothetical protein
MTYRDKKALALAMINLHAQMAAANVLAGSHNTGPAYIASSYQKEAREHINALKAKELEYKTICDEEEAEIRATTPRMM